MTEDYEKNYPFLSPVMRAELKANDQRAAARSNLVRDAFAGDPLAQTLILIWDRLEAAEKATATRTGADESTMQHLAYEAAAGARTEVRKLVQLETDRRWYRSAALALAGVVLGYAACWLTHA